MKRRIVAYSVFILAIIGSFMWFSGGKPEYSVPRYKPAMDVGALIQEYEGQLRVAREGVAFYKKLSERVAVPNVAEKKDTVYRFEPFKFGIEPAPGDSTQPEQRVDIDKFNFEYPYLINNGSGVLEVQTYNRFQNRYRTYTFDVGSRWSLSFQPYVENELGLITSTDYFRFSGFGVGAESGIEQNISFAVFARATLFSRVEVQVTGLLPAGVRGGVYILF